MRPSYCSVCLLVCLVLPVVLATLIATTAGTTAAITLGLTTTALTTAQATTLAAVGTGAAAVVGALAAGSLLHRRRYRRDVEGNSVCTNFENEELLYVLAANSDQLGCGQRLVCELEASNDANLSFVEQSILELFGRNVKPLKASQMLNPKSLYHYAAQVGSKAEHVDECAEIFDLCPLDRAAIMETYSRFSSATAIQEE